MENIEKNQNTNTQNKIISGIAIVALAIGAFALQQNRKKEEPSAMKPVATTPETKETTSMMVADYKNGTYKATGNYVSPGGPETVGVTLTLAQNIITDVTFEPQAERPISQKMQEDFAAHYKSEVVGKSIDEIALGKVSGSSLTPKGFNDAISKIKVEAKL
jgi:hypothetical protein